MPPCVEGGLRGPRRTAAQVVHQHRHFTRKNPFSKQAVRALTDYYYYMIWKHRDARDGFAP